MHIGKVQNRLGASRGANPAAGERYDSRPLRADSSMLGSPEARSLHREHPPVDLHADTLMWARWTGYDPAVRHAAPWPHTGWYGSVDVPRLVDGGLGAQFFGLVTLPVVERGCAQAAEEQIERLDALCRRVELLRRAQTASDLEGLAPGEVGALLGIEGAQCLEGDLDRVERFARSGVRYLGLVHFSATRAGAPAFEWTGRRPSEGLSPWGRELVRACEQSSVLVDLAHLNRAGFLEVCDMAQAPPIVSHTGVAGAHRHWRNLEDDQLRAIAKKGGVVGIMFAPRFLGGSGIDAVVAHLLHLLDVAGEDTPALGSDWDGMIVPTRGLVDPAHLPQLTDAMLRAGFAARTIAKILRHNVLRVLRETDRRAMCVRRV